VCLDFNMLPWAVNEAFRIAHSGRPGPVHIDLPKDIVSMRAKVPDSVFKRASQTMADAPPMLNMADIKKAVDLINNAKRPIFYVGQGASHCPEILAKVAKKANIPVTTTLHAMGIFDERESLSLHMLGMHGAAYANFAIQNSDCIVAIGSRFDDRTTGIVAKYAPKAKAAEAEGTGGIVHINIDKSAFGKVVKPTVAVWADTKDAMEALDDLIVTPTDPARADWVAQCQEWKTSYPFDYVKAPDGQIKTQQVAKPDCLSILIDGDGSFGMTNMDLQTVKRYQLPVKMAIMNDGRQQMVWIWQRLFFDGRYISVDNVNPDFVKLAQAYGIEAMSCDNEADLPGAIEKWLTFPGPMLMDFRVVPDICLPMVAPGKALDEMMLLQDRDAILGTSDEEMGTYKFEGLAPSCLHGSGLNGAFLRKQLGRMPLSLPKTIPGLEMFFLDGELPAPVAPEAQGAWKVVLSPEEQTVGARQYFEMWPEQADSSSHAWRVGDVGAGLERCWQAVRAEVDRGGPFFAVLGYSQGANVAAALLARQASTNEDLGLRCSVNLCGGLFSFWPLHDGLPSWSLPAGGVPLHSTAGERSVRQVNAAEEAFSFVAAQHQLLPLRGVPSLHVIGLADPYLAESRALVECYAAGCDRRIVEHAGGHLPLPAEKVARQQVSEEVISFLTDQARRHE
ncbi:unnamed protein product, partial [Polarella glacialis]